MDQQRKEELLSLAEALWDVRPGKREKVIERMKRIYVTCERGCCTTDSGVAHLVLPFIDRALQDQNPEVRIAGVLGVELFAQDAEHFIPKLADALSDTVVDVRIAALEALDEFGPSASAVAPLVMERCRDAPTDKERAVAKETLDGLNLKIKCPLHRTSNRNSEAKK